MSVDPFAAFREAFEISDGPTMLRIVARCRRCQSVTWSVDPRDASAPAALVRELEGHVAAHLTGKRKLQRG
jgi:hypothetical protein